MNECMVDLETMSSESDAPIVSIGAVVFDVDKSYDPLVAPAFYVNVDLKDVMQYGHLPYAGTIMWWLAQSDAARSALINPLPMPLALALELFTAFYQANKCDTLWSHATFDAVVLRSAYKSVNGVEGKQPVKIPWHYRDTRDIRTLKSLFGLAGVHSVPGGDYPLAVVEHNALDDAREQAWYTHQMLRKLKGNAAA